MDKLGRKFFLVAGTVSAGVCSAVMYFVTNKIENLIVSATFSAVISCANAALDCLITEVFPTNLRATGVAISMVFARLGGIIGNGKFNSRIIAIVSYYVFLFSLILVVIATLLDTMCPAPTFIVAGLLAGGGLMCLLLPDTTRKALS